MEPQKKKKFKLFDLYRDGKGVEKEEAGPPNLKNFFKLFGRKFTRLLSLNLYMLLEFLPLVLILYLFFTGEKTPSVTSPLYPALWAPHRSYNRRSWPRSSRSTASSFNCPLFLLALF